MNKIIEILQQEHQVESKLIPPVYFKLHESSPVPMFPIFYCPKTEGTLQADKYYHKHISRTTPCQ